MNKSLKVYEIDASQLKGKAVDALIPETIEGVKEAVRLNKNITARGGGTGLAGGCVPQNGIVIDLSKLNKISDLDKRRKTVVVEAGVILDELNDFLEKYNLEFPVKPSSHAVCTIGGMIATDAVGSRAIKHGRTSRWIESLEVVDSNGNIRQIGKAELSDFTGLEGTTGVIVKAKLKLIEKVKRTATLAELKTPEEVLELVRKLKRSSEVSMVEFFDKSVSEMIGLPKSYHMLVELESDAGKLKNEEYEKVMVLRDSIYPKLAEKGYYRIEDPKIFLENFKDILFWLEKNKIPVYGHLGVGILHPCFSEEQEKKIPELMKMVKKARGQITGEHGIGILKKQFVDEADKNLYLSVKKRNDPENKFNPGKIV